MKKIVFGGIMTVLIFSCVLVEATPGYLKKNSIKTCNGVTYGQHSSDNHWHVAVPNSKGGYNASGDPIYQDPCAGASGNDNSSSNYDSNNYSSAPTVIVKSSDTSLKTVKVDDTEITIQDVMSYETYEDNVSIVVSANDTKATVNYDSFPSLELGNNEIAISVTAEDGTSKVYTLNVERLKELSSNNKAVIKVDNKVLTFTNGESEVIDVSSKTDSLNIEYELEDITAVAEIIDNANFVEGENKVIVRVTAENGAVNDYIINVDKSSTLEDVVSTIVVFIIIGGLGYLVYRYIKKRKQK